MWLEMAMNDVRMMAVVGSRKMDVLGWQHAEREHREDREHRRGLLSTGAEHHGALSVPAKAQSNRRVPDPIVRRHDSLIASVAHGQRAICQCSGIFGVMGDVYGRDTKLTLQCGELAAQGHAQLAIETGERLVQEEQPRRPDKGTCQRDALLLATR